MYIIEKILYCYLCQVNALNGEDNVFTRFVISVCVFVQWHYVIITLTSLRHQQIVYCLSNAGHSYYNGSTIKYSLVNYFN